MTRTSVEMQEDEYSESRYARYWGYKIRGVSKMAVYKLSIKDVVQ